MREKIDVQYYFGLNWFQSIKYFFSKRYREKVCDIVEDASLEKGGKNE